LLGYGFAWTGHFMFEQNRRATFRHLFYSLAGDYVMFWQILTGRLRFQRSTPPGPRDSGVRFTAAR
jgi:hypothetical protein